MYLPLVVWLIGVRKSQHLSLSIRAAFDGRSISFFKVVSASLQCYTNALNVRIVGHIHTRHAMSQNQ